MKKIIIILLVVVGLVLVFKGKHVENKSEKKTAVEAKDSTKKIAKKAKIPGSINVSVKDVQDKMILDKKFAYCVGKDGEGENIRPEISWADAPKEAKSFAVIVLDADVPTDFTDAGKEGKVIPATQKRQDFIHYALVDVPANVNKIEDGKGRGAEKTQAKVGTSAVNDYAVFMPNADAKNYVGWDGMCPPWNDERVHNYQFIVYALRVESLGFKGEFAAKDAYKAIKENAIAYGKVTGSYTRNGI